MALVAEFAIHSEAMPLSDVAAAVPEATIELDVQYNHGGRPPFIVTVTHDDQGAVEAALAESPFVARYDVIGTSGDTRRYQVRPATSFEEQFADHIDDLAGLEALATEAAANLWIRPTPEGWIQRWWFADRDTFDAYREFWQAEAGFTLRELGEVGEPAAPGDGLTDPQREALRTAFELGYFEVPRGAELGEVASELGVSESAASERLRRAQHQLIERTVATTWAPLPE